MMKKIATLMIAILVLVGCAANKQQGQIENNTDTLNVITTFYPVYEFTKNIIGEEGEVSLLMTSGTEPHGYEPSAKDIAHMYESDVFVYLNENMEHWVEKLKASLKQEGVVVIKGTAGMTLMSENDEHDSEHHDEKENDEHDSEHHDEKESDEHDSEHHDEKENNEHDGEHHDEKENNEHDSEHHDEKENDEHGSEHHDEKENDEHDSDHHHEYDPHVWLSPKVSIEVVKTITEQLIEAYPTKAEIFTTNAKAYIEKLTYLDNEYKEALKDATTRTFVTQHAAFGYLAKEYQLNQVAITGLSSEVEPSPQRLAELSDFVKNHHVKYIYFEENASEKIAKTLANEAGVELLVLNPLESITQEQMDSGEDYISIMKANLQALLKTTTQ